VAIGLLQSAVLLSLVSAEPLTSISTRNFRAEGGWGVEGVPMRKV
jgi:hypothetical protein